ncbi:hypothetical protein PFLG_01204 [Plasmodium falciparum RAJ116]|uniref:Erythrocyte membrane protein 1 n=1 Tax=Plasmodium falciparum RAJ116 TaxID=580058 RepID=A0A0L0CX50_PLAFA|nr:hypothetical protein PFLG_01204 [Plasmodium falciparum RAJ116]
MVRPQRAPTATIDYTNVNDAKELLDKIGEEIYKKAKDEALTRSESRLKGFLKQAKFSNGDKVTTENPCNLSYDYDTAVTSTVIDPCKHKSEKRFSEVSGAECDEKKIKDSKSNCGACAPFRRLHVCDKNLEQIIPQKITATDNLLVDVCMAAQFEGKSITGRYPPYQTKYGDSGSPMCTMLARSFADLGDIIRGKDLFIGYDEKEEKRRDKLEKSLKTIFGNIYNNLVREKPQAKEHYQDENGGNYYKLREDWWTLNRKKVWKAMTCDDRLRGNAYFHATCGRGRDATLTPSQCRCVIGDVPTYFDYVPQFLRWFEEWAEDFCRKKKKKVENAKKFCRGEDDNKYCSRNGFDCEETVRAKRELVKGDDCHKCSVACSNFEPWIKNQKQEFEKQKRKYDEEIKKAKAEEETSNGKSNNIYEKEFYKELNKQYGDVEEFLKKLNNETICKKPTEVGKEIGSPVDFTKPNVEKTFSHKEYCDTCPWCAKKIKNQQGKWTDQQYYDCPNEQSTPFDVSNTTDIKILSREKGKPNILDKYKHFCKNSNKETENWQCHYEKKSEYEDGFDKDYCVLQDGNQNIKDQTIMSFDSFFWGWIDEMLDDSIKWRTEHSECINKKEETKCIEGCKKTCECFRNWVKQKEKEWEEIEKHFDKQKNMTKQDRYITLQFILNHFFMDKIKKAYGDKDESKELMEKLNSIKGFHAGADTEHSQDAIKILLEHEKEIAEKCVENNKQETCPTSDTASFGRSNTPTQPRIITRVTEDPEEEEEEEETPPADATEETKQVEEGTTQQEVEETKVDKVKPACQIVDDLFKKPENLSDACTLKYVTGKNYGWKCVPTKPNGDSTRQEGEASNRRVARQTSESGESGGDKDGVPGKSDGSICVPPRRRRLYIQKLHEWANSSGSNTVVSGQAQTQSPVAVSQSSSTDNGVSTSTTESSLLHAFIESAAVETFFLWHRYKKEWEHRNNKTQEGSQLLQPPDGNSDDDNNPQKKLEKGEIPEEFKRQMFYTFGDYKDIFFGKHVGNGKDVGKDSVTTNISDKITRIFKDHSQLPSGKPNNERETWWNNNAKAIWDGMVCALSYNTNDQKVILDVQKKLMEAIKNKNKYYYNNVTIGSIPISPDKNATTTKLIDFASRPTFYRWLEEWGEEFCRKRKVKLKKVKKECDGFNASGNKIQCSADGHDCTDKKRRYNNIFADLDCADCQKECRNYKKWIENKENEFNKQKKKYQMEINENNIFPFNNDNEHKFYENLRENGYSFVENFLESLNHCKPGQGSSDPKQTTDFMKYHETFGPSTYCKACPIYGVKCNSGGCTDITVDEYKRQNDLQEIKIIKNTPTNIDVQMIDRRGQYIQDNLKDRFKESRLFKTVKDQEWKCSFINNMDVCKVDKFDKNIDIDEQITFKILLERWLQDFLEGYYISKTKIDLCTKSENSCIQEHIGKCECVEKWVEKKKKEWEQIDDHFNKQQHDNAFDMPYKVKNYFENNAPNLIKSIEEYKRRKKIDEYEDCNGDSSCKRSDKKKKIDMVSMLLSELKEKIEPCKNPLHQKTQSNYCNTSPPENDESTSTSTLTPDEQTDDTTDIEKPSFCPDDTHIPSPPTPEEPAASSEDKSDQVPKSQEDEVPQEPSPPDKKAPVPKKEENVAPKVPKPKPPDLSEPLKNAMLSNTIMWSVGIGFAALTYWWLKKKSKPPVDLLRVLNIPKGDYGIPTLKSTNRYIPYGTDRYKGKTYIYMEGDTDEDKYTFMSDTTDITSSSESEYEEIDINDIYVPGSPKYKTLIEVVLEPSKRDTSNKSSGTKDTQNITTSDTPRNKPINDVEWNSLKNDFISNILQNSQMDLPQNNISRDTSINIHPAVSILQDSMQEKPFITSIQDRDLHNGEEVTYNINLDDHKNMNFSTNHDNITPKNNQNDLYTGIDLINDSISGNHNVDIYDELLKRKENELFGTNHTKHTTTNSVAKQTHNEPIVNQINLFHKWLDRHKNMCEQWDKNKKEEFLDKLKKEWNKENNNNSGDINNRYENVLNTDVSIQIDMNDPKPINEFTNMNTNSDNFIKDTILDDLDKHPETYFYDIYDDDITYFDTDDVKPPMDDIHIKEQTEMNALHNNKMNELLEKEYPISDIWNI